VLLAPYPHDSYKITHRQMADIGEFLPYIGSISRYFKPKEPNYYDDIVDEWISGTGEDPNKYSRYAVVPKRLGLATKAITRYDRVPDPFSKEVHHFYDVAGEWMEKTFAPFLCESNVCSYDYMTEWLSPDKSPGMPWTHKYPFKCDYWNSPDADFYSVYWTALATKDYIRSLCSVSIKEEVRLKEKIDRDEVRTIIAMDVNHVVAHGQLCLEQNQRLVASHEDHPIKLGINMFGGGWHRLNHRMSRFGSGANTIELDGKKFDGRFRYYCFEKIRDFRFKMLSAEQRTEANKTRLRNIYYELAHAPLVNVDGCVYGRSSGNPSGQGSTTPDNSLKNYQDVVVLWHLTMPEEMRTYDIFTSFTEICIVGDDINISVHPSIHHLFNVAAIRRVMSEIDMEYHFAAEEFRHNYECTFLGHAFSLVDIDGLDRAMYLPVIDCERMRSNMLIYNAKHTVDNTIVRACGLRNETFACKDCRVWFNDLIMFLLSRYGRDLKCVDAFKNYLTDRELWELYSGLSALTCESMTHKTTCAYNNSQSLNVWFDMRCRGIVCRCFDNQPWCGVIPPGNS